MSARGTLPDRLLAVHGRAHRRWIRAARCGDTARRFLATARGGKVIAVLRSSFYAAEGDGIACIGHAGIEPGALNVVTDASPGVDWTALGVVAGGRWRIAGDVLHVVGVPLRVDLSGAALWLPRGLAGAWSPDVTRCALSTLLAMAALRMPRDGLGRIALAAARPPAGPPLLALAWPAVAALRGWLSESLYPGAAPSPARLAHVRPLVGLGPGLTPSGDDLLGGVMIALRALGREDVCSRLWRAAAPWARAAGNAVSFAHLGAAAEGCAGAGVHDLVGALQAGTRAALAASLERVERYGHTSGWDALAGVVTAVDVWLEAAAIGACAGD